MKTLLCSLLLGAAFGAQAADKPPIAIAIHGGAGTITRANLSPDQEKAYHAKLTQALNAGYAVLDKGGSSLDAVQAAIMVMEDSPLFNAGKGAVYNWDGEHELDASIMDGKTLNAGAVAGVKTVKHPILAAYKVMMDSPHVLLSGAGADAFAKSEGLDTVNNHYFDTEARKRALDKAKKAISQTGYQARNYLAGDYKYGTVGAVALDANGNLAAATSTGGMTAKRYGRIGDSPIIGAGTYAENGVCAVSSTGHGEYFIRLNIAADICARVRYQGKDVTTAANEVIHGRLQSLGGTGGVIVMGADGSITQPFNTEGMYRGYKTRTEEKTLIYGNP
ncbi:MAG: isoaspartyl peptidase/L-asparaginase [Pseudomonadota bacterium]|uniref:isoaspartyl peptidase/L-asparaginase family protein n=1 Tax=Gallaecimonas pentaromativorans TaxID=584787 RepID=UPI00067E68D5|nr:isoaspartyl peptidase/L-asparaginase [Gallaecimonas pentaromativorans]MED5523919.1 isoaspartyl peptidase/L-asparaginase [Pseudomonadota bacterium]